MIGALAIELPIDRDQRVMTVGGEWDANGLGATGETYLVGRDGLMRSISRQLDEDPAAYQKRAVAAGLAPAAAALSVQNGDTLLQQSDHRRRRDAAHSRGEDGTLLERDYLGRDSLPHTRR